MHSSNICLSNSFRSEYSVVGTYNAAVIFFFCKHNDCIIQTVVLSLLESCQAEEQDVRQVL